MDYQRSQPREIKFRGWVKDLQMMIDEWLVWDERWFFKPFEAGQYVPMQYTGLKDKNGKEIYEGDILVFHNQWGEETWRDVIEWATQEGDVGNSQSEFSGYPISDGSTYEVIGNIYENPELVEAGAK